MMKTEQKIEELKQAHEQGLLSDADFNERMVVLLTELTQQKDGNNSMAGDLTKRALKSDLAANMAAGAAGGAVIASVVPLVGTATSAVVGTAALGAYKNLAKK